jgi:glycyl-tRNA synthetase beta chain
MVGEFPELQGVMGGYYARAEGLPDAVADAIRDHYKPVGQGDDVPTAPVTVAVSLADKLDTICSFFFEDMPPSGTRDPFALRRSALAIIRLVLANNVRLSLGGAVANTVGRVAAMQIGRLTRAKVEELIASLEALEGPLPQHDRDEILEHYADQLRNRQFAEKLLQEQFDSTKAGIATFFADRLKVQQREAGVRHDLIDAVFALGGEDDLVRLLARVKALQAFVETEEGANLLAGYRRAANILRAEAKKDAASSRHPELGSGSIRTPSEVARMDADLRQHDETEKFVFPYTPDAAEAKLAEVLDAQLPLAEAAIEAEDFEGAMTALSVIRPSIDRFFDDVTVNSEDQAKRSTRLALLDKLRAAMHKVADFSKIEG